MARRKFVYQKYTAEDNERQILRASFRERQIQRAGFRDALRQADGGNLEPMHAYLRTFLPADYHADALIKRLKRVRRDLKKPPTLEREDEDAIIGLTRVRLRFERLRVRGTGKRVSYKRVIPQAARVLAEAGELRGNPKRIDWQRIADTVKRGKRRRS
jgi:hypothetical protein